MSLFRLSISFENVDTAKKKLPVHVLDGLTLSYKVNGPVPFTDTKRCMESGIFCSNFVFVFIGALACGHCYKFGMSKNL